MITGELTAVEIAVLNQLIEPLVHEFKRLRKEQVRQSESMTEEDRDWSEWEYSDRGLQAQTCLLVHLLLEASEVDGLGGCQLCKG